MKKVMTGLMLGAMMLAGTMANAAQTVEGGPVSLTYGYAWWAPGASLQQVSSAAGTVSFAFSNPAIIDIFASPDGEVSINSRSYFNVDGAVASGYRIDAVSLSLTFDGSLTPPEPPFGCTSCYQYQPGEAENGGSALLTITENQVSNTYGGLGYRDIVAEQTQTWTGNQQLEGEFRVSGDIEGYAMGIPSLWGMPQPGRDDYYFAQYASATMQVSNAVLTFHVSAVPEPGTYAMLAAGLVLVGVQVRRRKNQAGQGAIA